MAHITKISEGKYRIRVSRGTGAKRQQPSETFTGTLAEARSYARDQETLIHTGRISNTRITFKQFFDIWLAAVTPTLAPRTVDGYEGNIRRYALDALGPVKLRRIENGHIQQIYNAMTELSPTTVSNLNASLRACFNWGLKRDYLKINPCRLTERRPKSAPDIVVLDNAEAMAFADACRTTPGGVILEFALETAMRPEEYLALRWRDIRGNDVSVVQVVQYNREGGGYYFKDVKTKKGRRRIPISERLRLRLVQHRREQNEHRLAMKGTWFNHDLVFPNIIGRPIEQTNLISRTLRPVLSAMWPDTELPDGSIQRHPARKPITLYSLRHTCATLLLMAGTNPKIVADRLGHASVVQTLDTYSHVLPHIQDEATEVMDRIMRAV